MTFPNSFQSGSGDTEQPPFAMVAFSAAIIAGFAVWFYFEVEFAPALNDIISIYKIAALDGAGKWINGFYGPGYTLILILAGESFVPLAVLSTILMVISFVLVSRLTALLMKGEHFLSIFTTLIFFLLLFAVLKTNYSDAIFVYLLFSGLALYLYGYFSEIRNRVRGRKRNMPLEMLGLIIAGSVVLFRHHGLVFLLIFLTLLTVLGPNWIGRFPFRRIVGIYSALLVTFVGLFILSLFVREFQHVNWQTFNLYKFFYGMDWYRVDQVLDSPSYLQFSILGTVAEQPFYSLTRIGAAIYQELLPILIVTGIPALGYLITKDRFHLVVLVTILAYIAMVLPGLDRGLYPLMLIVFLSFVLLLYRSMMILPGFFGMLLVLLAVGGGSVHHLLIKRSQLQDHNRYIREEVEQTLRTMGAVDAGTLFTDDYNLVLFSYNTLDINNFQGWLNLHPDFQDLHPNTIFQQHLFDDHDIDYVVYLRNGYISETYPDLPCVEQSTLNEHHICKL